MAISILFFTDFNLLIELLERYISSDGEIMAKNHYFAVATLCLCPLYFFVVFILAVYIYKFFSAKMSIYLLIYFIIFFTHLIINLNPSYIFGEDGFLEWTTVVVSILATILFFFASAFGVRCAFFLGFFWLIFAMEEISWGQRVFGIDSPQFVENYNYQNELNLHNFLNPVIEYLYLIFFLIIASIFTSFRNAHLLSSIYSSPSVYFVMKVGDKYNIAVMLILCVLVSPAYFELTEFLEQQLALIGLILSVTILRELKLKK